MRLTKKIASAVLALTLVVAMSAQCFGATWGSYFGYGVAGEGEWYEGAMGEVSAQTATSWTADVSQLGWGGCWGGQVFQDTSKGNGKVSVKKGQKYTVSFTLESTNCDKVVYVKIANGDGIENLAHGFWVQLKRGQAQKVTETFTAQANASSIYFAIGGEMGDRSGIDVDAEIRYSKAPVDMAYDADPMAATQIKLTKFSLAQSKPAKVTLKKVKAVKGGKAKVTYKKIKGVAGYQINYKVAGKKAKNVTTKKATYTLKKLAKGKKVTVKVRAFFKSGSKKIWGDWSKKKTVKVK